VEEEVEAMLVIKEARSEYEAFPFISASMRRWWIRIKVLSS